MTPEPHIKTLGFLQSTSFSLKILINSDFLLKVFVSRSMQSRKGIFLDPGMHPFLRFGRGSSDFPSKRSWLLASTKVNKLFLILSSICLFFLSSQNFRLLYTYFLYLFYLYN